MIEHGFWDYPCPGAGGMEMYEMDDYLLLLDDMAQAGMNSLMIAVRWNTTGYRSNLPFFEQIPGNPIIESDNELLRKVIREAHSRGIKVRLSSCMNFDPRLYGGTPNALYSLEIPGYGTVQSGIYDPDHPGFTERAAQIFTELVELFPDTDGFIVEMEDTGTEAPHRIPLYNKWAEENGRPSFEALGHPFRPRVFDLSAWRDYTTESRLRTLREIEKAVRSTGFSGDFGMICETAATDYSVGQEVNLRMYRDTLPDWLAVTYEYNKVYHRYAMMDFCVAEPKKEGLKVFYLPRGVMTWHVYPYWPLPVPLEESWRMDVEDINLFKPDGLWWFGSGTKNDGSHVSLSRLRELGYEDGVAARRALLDVVRGR